MGLLDKINDLLDAKINELTDQPRAFTVPSRAVRSLDSDDVEAFMHAAEDRPGPYGGRGQPRAASPTTRDRFLREVRTTNPLRFHRLERDIKWLRREALRRGLDPEEVRWMV